MSHLPLLPKQARRNHFPKNTLGPIDNFLPEDRVNTWQRAVTSPSSTETPQNLIAMVTHAHPYWDKARFALKPLEISDDGKTLVVQFFWMPEPYKGEGDGLKVNHCYTIKYSAMFQLSSPTCYSLAS